MGDPARKLEKIEGGKNKKPAGSALMKPAKESREKTKALIDSAQMLKCLKEGNILEASKAKMNIADVIDPASVEGYEDAVKECMRLTVKNSDEYTIDSVFILKSDFGKEIDFRSVEGYEKAVKDTLLDYLGKEWFLDALKVKKELGNGMVFGKTKGYEKTVKWAFLNRIKNAEMKEAFEVFADFGEDIDFSKEIEKAFLYLLKSGYPYEATELEREFGADFHLRSIEGYEKAVQQGIRSCLKDRDENAAVLMESNFGEGNVVPFTRKKASETLKQRGAKAA